MSTAEWMPLTLPPGATCRMVGVTVVFVRPAAREWEWGSDAIGWSPCETRDVGQRRADGWFAGRKAVGK